MGVSAIGSSTDYLYGKMAAGKRIQTAADDAAGLSIAHKLLKENNGLDVGASNIRDSIGAVNVMDGALGTMQDSLQRIRELSVKSMNGLYGDSERKMIQNEIDQLMEDVQRSAVGTQYNQLKLLDGSMADMHVASNPDGTGMKLGMENVTLQNLGIGGYNVTGKFSLDDIDGAIDRISRARSRAGAATNAMEHAYNYNKRASQELTGSRSRIEDLDMPKAVSEQKKNRLMQDYRLGMMRRQTQDGSMVLKLFQNM